MSRLWKRAKAKKEKREGVQNVYINVPIIKMQESSINTPADAERIIQSINQYLQDWKNHV